MLWLGAPGALGIFAISFCQIYVKTKKKVLLFERGTLGTLLFGNSARVLINVQEKTR